MVMLTWILGYLVVGFFIYWLCTALFGIDNDVPLFLQILGIGLWPIVVALASVRTLAARPVDEIAMETALHRHDAPPIQPDTPTSRRHARLNVIYRH